MGEALEITFIRNRIAFVGMKTPAYFSSVILAYEKYPRTPTYKRLWLSVLDPETRGYSLPAPEDRPQ